MVNTAISAHQLTMKIFGIFMSAFSYLIYNLFKTPDQNWKNGWHYPAKRKQSIHGLCLLCNDCSFKNDVYEHCNCILQIDKKGKKFEGYIVLLLRVGILRSNFLNLLFFLYTVMVHCLMLQMKYAILWYRWS